MKFSKVIIKMIVLSLILFSCNNEPGKHTTTATEKEKSSVPEKATTFNADSAYAFVKAQVGFGPRVNNTPAHEKCGNYLEKKLKEYCTDVIIQQGQVKAFNGTLLKFRNFIASYNPGTNNRIFICSHWDSRPWADHDPDKAKRRTAIDGANDGASGVGIILEIARQLSLSKPATGVDLLLLDAEDYGPPEDTKQPGEDTSDWWALGSQYWAKHPHKDNYYAKFGILLDMVGAPHATFLQEGISMHYAPGVVRSIWEVASRIGFSDYFLFNPGDQITDDHVCINQILGIPTIDMIDLRQQPDGRTPFYPYWHTTKDDINSIDKNTLNAVGMTLMEVINEQK